MFSAPSNPHLVQKCLPENMKKCNLVGKKV